jgi:hypothetical protein
MHASNVMHTTPSKSNKMVNEADMQAALVKLREMDVPNFTEVAIEFNLFRTTLSRRFYEQTVSRAEVASNLFKNLHDAQELALLQEINRLSDLGLHFTPQILQTTVE